MPATSAQLRRRTIALFIIAAAALLLFLGVRQALRVGAGYKAKLACSAAFVSGLPDATIQAEDVSQYPFISTSIDREARMASAGTLGLFRRTAVWREGLGCTLCTGVDEDKLHADVERFEPLDIPFNAAETWPLGDATFPGPDVHRISMGHLQRAVEAAFAEPRSDSLRRTRAVIVLYDGRIVAERYAPGIGPETPLQGWSMTKTVTGALVGAMAGRGELSRSDTGLVKLWTTKGDRRAEISLDHMLRMSSGLDWSEGYLWPFSDVLQMLFTEPSTSNWAKHKPLAAEPGEKWSYSSGTTNIIQHYLRERVFDSFEIAPEEEIGEEEWKRLDREAWYAYLNLPRRLLFGPLGMTSAVMEPDPAGNFVGSSFMYATARDWARFGLLLAQDGVWQGKRILPEGWVDYMTTPAPAAGGKFYGAHTWLNAGGWMTDVPRDAFHASGHDGQYLSVVPSKKLVVVRLGLSFGRTWDQEAFLADVISTLP